MPKKIAPSFFFIGNHPVLDFINTKIAVDGKPVELLETFPNLLDWLHKVGFLNENEIEMYEQNWGNSVQGAQVLEAAILLRGTLLTSIQICKSGGKIPENSLEVMNSFLRNQLITTRLIDTENGFRLEKHVTIQNPPDLLLPVAEAAADFFSKNDFTFVKKCGNPACVLYFYDNSKNSTRRWCSQKTCGNRMKVTAYLERHRNKKELMNES